MDQLLPVINKLQDVFNAVGGERIDLPQICVVGSQSSGKSSVLEHIVGKDFLPRGSGIVTRRPLVLQLYHLPKSKYGEEPKEWGEFLHIPNKHFDDFDKIREEIEAETNRHCGPRGISRVPIRLSVYSPNVLNLTLVDLPGLTKVTIPGQPANLPEQIRAMALEYVSNPNAIILCVSAANTDLSNSDGIQLAKEIDPDGQRTFGVITKIDIMDKGTDALEMLTGKTIPLRLGYVGVVMRSQQDILDKKSIKQALLDEEKFFASHPVYRPISSRLGTRFCTKSLNTLLMNHIRKTLPELKQRISKMMHDCQTEMSTYGDGFFDNQSKSAMLLNIINNFNSDYTNAIDGKLEESVSELYGGARINIIFTDVYGKYVEGIRSGENLSEQDIRTAIKNSAGPRGALIVPEGSFEFLVKSLIKKLEDPSLECAEQVFGELQKIVAKLCESRELKRFQNLRTRILEVVNNLLLNCKLPTRTMISHLIGLELAYINTNHEEFIGGGGAVAKLYETMAAAHRVENQPSQAYNPSGGPPPQSVNPSGGPPNPNQPKPGQPGQGQGPQQPGQPGQGQGPQQPGQPGAPPEGGFFGRYFGGNPQGGPQQGGPQGGPQQGGPQQGGPQPGQGQPGQPQGVQPLRPTTSQPLLNQQQPKTDLRKVTESNPFQASPGGPIVLTIPSSIRVGPVTTQEKFETQLIQELIFSYFNIVCKNLKDTVPKSIMHFLVSTSKINMQSELVRYLYKEELFEELLEENPEIAKRRTRCKEMLDALSKANIVLMELRDFDVR